jgi:hypothetical protein
MPGDPDVAGLTLRPSFMGRRVGDVPRAFATRVCAYRTVGTVWIKPERDTSCSAFRRH